MLGTDRKRRIYQRMNTVSTRLPVLTIRGLCKSFGKSVILNNIDLDVFPGEIFGFLGPNGSGKTTTIKLMLGLLRIDQGQISICGHDIVKDFEGALSGVGGIIENPEMYKYLTGRQNLEQYSRMYGDGSVDHARIDELARLVHLDERIDDKVSKYSLGMRQRLGLAQALINRPRLLVLDEPTNGLDPAGIKDLRDTLRELAHSEDVAVFISSHQLAELDLMCDRVAVIDRGVVLSTMTIDEVRNAGDGKNITLTIEADLKGAELTPELDSVLRLTPDGLYRGSAERDQIPGIVAGLVGLGADIYSVNIEKHSIEEVFLRLTSDYSPAGQSYAPVQDTRDTEVQGGNAQ